MVHKYYASVKTVRIPTTLHDNHRLEKHDK